MTNMRLPKKRSLLSILAFGLFLIVVGVDSGGLRSDDSVEVPRTMDEVAEREAVGDKRMVGFFVGVGVGVGVFVGFGVQVLVGSGVWVGSSVGVGVGVGNGSVRVTITTASSPVELSLAPV